MKIIETRMAPNPRRVRIFLKEKGIEIPYEQISIMEDEHKSEDFTKRNPGQRVPVLVLDDGTYIAETVAICRYFEELQPSPALFGTGPLERAIVEMWNRRMEHGLFFHVAQHFRHLNPNMAGLEVPQVKEWGEANAPKAVECMEILDAQLANSAYVAGANYSIADITAMVAIDFLKPAQLNVPENLTNIARWHEELSARPSAEA